MRLALVTIEQMDAAPVNAVETSAGGFRIVEVPEIRRAKISMTSAGNAAVRKS